MGSARRENKPKVLTQKELAELPPALRAMYGDRGHLLKQYRPCCRCHIESKAKGSQYCIECGRIVRNSNTTKEQRSEWNARSWEKIKDRRNAERVKQYQEKKKKRFNDLITKRLDTD